MARQTAIGVAVVGTVLVVAYALLAGAQILVLNPLAAAPGRTLEEIHADLASANEVIFTPVVVGILAPGPAIALGILTATLYVTSLAALVAMVPIGALAVARAARSDRPFPLVLAD